MSRASKCYSSKYQYFQLFSSCDRDRRLNFSLEIADIQVHRFISERPGRKHSEPLVNIETLKQIQKIGAKVMLISYKTVFQIRKWTSNSNSARKTTLESVFLNAILRQAEKTKIVGRTRT